MRRAVYLLFAQAGHPKSSRAGAPLLISSPCRWRFPRGGTKMKGSMAVLLSVFLTCGPALAEEPGLFPQAVQDTVQSSLLTNRDVLDMVRAGLSQDLIIAKIRSTPSKFDTSPTALSELKADGVAEAILLAMVGSSTTPPEPDATTGQPEGATGLAPAAQAQAAAVRIAIPDGTPVEIEVVENVSSEAVQEGTPIDFTVVQPVKINGIEVIARGAPAKGRIVEVKKARHWGRAGKLVWAIQDVHAVDGQRIPLRLSKELEGGGSSGKVAAAVVATAIVFFPAAPLWGLKKGKPAILPAGTRVTSFTQGESAVQAKEVSSEQ